MTVGSVINDYSLASRSKAAGFLWDYAGSFWYLDYDDPWVDFTVNRKETHTWSGTDDPPRPDKAWKVFSYEVPHVSFVGKGKARHPVTVYKKRKVRFREKVNPNRFRTPHPFVSERLVDFDVSLPLVTENVTYVVSGQNAKLVYYAGKPASAWIGNPFQDALFDSNDQINLVNKLSEKIRGSDFNPSVFIAEGHEALTMIAQNAYSIAAAIRYARNGEMRRAADVLTANRTNDRISKQKFGSGYKLKDTLSERWLELQYGWLPLLSDVKSGAEMVAHLTSVPFSQRFKVSRGKQGTISCPYPLVNAYTRRHRQIVAYLSEDPNTIFNLSGLADPELVLWEKLPWSFVADWFIPIGNFLQARAAASKMVGTFVTTELLYQFHNGLNGPYGSTDGVYNTSIVFNADGDCRFRRVLMTRSISDRLDVPLPGFKSLMQVASWKHCANAVALLVGISK